MEISAAQTDFTFLFVQYRTPKNFRDPTYILPRVMDKLLVFTIIATLYLNRAGQLTPESVNNVTAMRELPILNSGLQFTPLQDKGVVEWSDFAP